MIMYKKYKCYWQMCYSRLCIKIYLLLLLYHSHAEFFDDTNLTNVKKLHAGTMDVADTLR